MDIRLANRRQDSMVRSMMKGDASMAKNPDAAAIGFIQKVSASILGIDDLSDTESLLKVVLDLAEQLVRKRQRETMMAKTQSHILKAHSTLREEDLKREVLEMDGMESVGPKDKESPTAKVTDLLASLEAEMEEEPPRRKSPAARPTSQSLSSSRSSDLSSSRSSESVRSKLERLREIAKELN